MKKNFYILTLVLLLFVLSPARGQFTTIAQDSVGDGYDPSLLDGTALDFYYDAITDSLWFNIYVDDINASHEAAFGVNVMVNIPNGGNTFNFWGMHNNAPFHRLITVWVTGTAPSNYSGTIGVGDHIGVSSTNYTNLSQNNISIWVDVPGNLIMIGLKRSDVIPDIHFTNNTVSVEVAAAVGSNISWNDDIYEVGASATITLTTGINNPLVDEGIKVFLNSSMQQLTIDMKKTKLADPKFILCDISGKTIKEKSGIGAGTYTFSTAGLSKGIYLINIFEGNRKIKEQKIYIE